ncbi:MAG: hypothetical protein KME26_26145 [Oscillatoria princeps RMCB-10]|jgi:hypothetical protein|nr:hypothetical protein [Oscillatoria princeps RMCB-10]
MKQADSFELLKKWSLSLGWLIPAGYCFIAFLPFPRGISTGLDPSWKYAISRLAADRAIFGQDIIFTYGSLGYLIRGAALDDNFFPIVAFRVAVHTVLFGLALWKIATSKTALQKASLALSVLFPYLISDEYEACQTEYQILFIFIILLSSDRILRPNSIRWWAAGLGGLAGFLAHTKVSLGPFTAVSLLLFLGANVCRCLTSKFDFIHIVRGGEIEALPRYYRSQTVGAVPPCPPRNEGSDLRISCFALADAVLAGGTSAFIFLGQNIWLSLGKTVACLVFAAAVGGVIWRAGGKFGVAECGDETVGAIPPRSPHNGEGAGTGACPYRHYLNSRVAGWLGFYLVYGICLAGAIIFSSPSLLSYLRGYLEITSGYSSAMSIVGSSWELGLALSEIALIAALLFIIARQGNPSFAAAIALILLLDFKHGFVRQGGHVLRFFFCVPLIVSLCALKIRKEWLQKLSYVIHIYALILAAAHYNYYSQIIPELLTGNMSRPLAPAAVAQKASFLWDLRELQAALDAKSQANLDKVKLPEKVVRLLKDKPVDIIPWEISLVPANRLNWQPRPIFQSQAAYTTFLDEVNRQSLATQPRDYILYNFLAVDGRHPFFDEPSTFFQVFCNYRLSPEIPDFINMPAVSNLMVLERRQSGICTPGVAGRTFSMKWNESKSLEAGDGFIIRAGIKFEYTLFGKIYKTFFRVPPVMLRVTYMGGLRRDYRILPGNSANGVTVSHLPANDSEALSFFRGKLAGRVKSFSFAISNPLLFQPDIAVSLTSHNLLDTFVKELPWIDVSQLKGIKFLGKTDGYMGHLDSQAEQKFFRQGDAISAYGWAAVKSGKTVWVIITSGATNKPLAIAQTGTPRQDVAKALNNRAYINAGWSINFSSDALEKGAQDIKAWIYDPAGNFAIPLAGTYRIEVR